MIYGRYNCGVVTFEIDSIMLKMYSYATALCVEGQLEEMELLLLLLIIMHFDGQKVIPI